LVSQLIFMVVMKRWIQSPGSTVWARRGERDGVEES